MTKTKLFKQNSKHKTLYHAFMESILEDEDAMDKGVGDKLIKRKPDDADRDEAPPARPDQGLKRRKTGKETKPSKKAKSTRTSKSTTKSQPKSTGKSAQAEETMFETGERPPTLDPEWNEGPAYKLLKGTCRSYIELEYNMEECYKALNDKLDWNNPEGDRYPFDLSKPLPLVKSRNYQIFLVAYFFNNDLAYLQGESTGRTYRTSLTKTKAAKYDLPGIEDMNNPEGDRYPFNLSKPLPLIKSRNSQIVLVDYFFNNDLAYLQGENTGRTYTTSLTKIKAAKYDLKGIKYMVPNLWSTIKVAYEKHALLDGELNQRSDQKTVKVQGRRLSKLHLNDIEDMLLLVVQNRLFNLEVMSLHFAAALRMFTRRVVIQKRVEDLQLGVESYQKKLNISKPRKNKEDLS
ncbi:hypothetical protein Tco_0779892 [Tanacetum coccineum]